MNLRSPTELGLAIRARRKSLGLDQKTLAERVGVSRQWIVEVHGGKERAEVGLVLRILRALGLDLTIEKPGQVRAQSPALITADDITRLIDAHRQPKGQPP